MLDIKKIVEEKDIVEKALLKRMNKEELDLDIIVDLYNKKKEILKEFEEKRAGQNSFNTKMAQVEKGSEEFLKLVKELKELANEVKELDEKLRKIEEELTEKLEVLPNIPDDDVVAGGKESNEIVKTSGEKPLFDFEIKDHVQLGEELQLFDFERASKMSGSNFSMYKGMGARLEWALINYFVDEHIKDGYEMIIPPHIVGEQSGYCAGQLPKFKNDVYWLEDEDQFLIPTAETVLTNIYRDEILNEEDLPKKFFAYTPCYRKEAGSYRANERGLIRVHQFNKVEMYQFVKAQDSEKALEELVTKAEKLVAGLGLHYQVSKLAAGDCSAGAAKTYDVEVWLPAIGQYYEVSSISNVREYQSRRGNMRYKSKEDGKNMFVHTLNASGLATSRLMVAIVETYQQKDGSLVVPEILRKYIGVDKIEK
ncbi:serine--tRNA ligase [Candidatus Dojkabacteria bacterium HGW-Dojkabacteria-1]|uniref:Serine--tRNA ligase n=1 Tax=Candidatus Dojkabacteria bacterium HGW-Dojkabacteria-1 TaxID=2013761 RepID=A0A2N2F370_9BACT|nr:MAG: serine--tRNA ligase [Candidatus Dojkabacteria bacterium HGW-Dojkabacteria-1]